MKRLRTETAVDLCAVANEIVCSVVPIMSRPTPAEEDDLPRIANVVLSVELLAPGYRLPLEVIASQLGCSQYAPVDFAANILRFRDMFTDCTVLVFASGKVVVVSVRSMPHMRFVSQMLRLVIEQLRCPMLDEHGSVYIGTLQGRTVFQNCNVHNIVGHGFLGCRIDLQAMCDAAPACCKWFPDLFPGLKCKIWLAPEYRCICGATEAVEGVKLGGKCTCFVKMIIFDTGKIVIPGSRNIRDINSVFYRIKLMAPRFESGPHGASIPREDRFYQRLSTMMVPTGLTTKNVREVKRATLTASEAIASVLTGCAQKRPPPPSVASGGGGSTVTPLMRMADEGRVAEVRMAMLIDPAQLHVTDDQGRNVLARLRRIPLQERSPQHAEIITLLVKMMGNPP